jgi:hypothetical protein
VAQSLPLKRIKAEAKNLFVKTPSQDQNGNTRTISQQRLISARAFHYRMRQRGRGQSDYVASPDSNVTPTGTVENNAQANAFPEQLAQELLVKTTREWKTFHGGGDDAS